MAKFYVEWLVDVPNPHSHFEECGNSPLRDVQYNFSVAALTLGLGDLVGTLSFRSRELTQLQSDLLWFDHGRAPCTS